MIPAIVLTGNQNKTRMKTSIRYAREREGERDKREMRERVIERERER